MTPEKTQLLKAKLRAAALHLLVSAVVVGAAAWLVFGLWYPDPYAVMLGGTKLFLLVAACDLVLGPVLTLVAYTPTKARRLLVLDYIIIGGLQLASLGYGLNISAQTRPVVLSFTTDRFDVVSPSELDEVDLLRASAPYNKLSLTGPKMAWAKPPVDSQELSRITLDSLSGGKDMQHRPYLYVPYEQAREQVIARAKKIETIKTNNPAVRPYLDKFLAERNLKSEDVRWVLVKHRRGFWSALVRADNAALLGFVPHDLYE